jgi:Ca2+-binding RTX toxin-like protein
MDTDTLASIENAIGSRFNDTLFGDNLDNVFSGGASGSDQINGGGGVDTVSYVTSAGAVLINLAGQSAADGIDTDTLSSIENAIGSAFGDTIVSSDASNRIDGDLGSDTVSYVAASRAMLINLGAQSATDGIVTDTLVSIENATGSPFDDTIVSGEGPNRIDGSAGSDTVSYATAARAMLISLPAGAATDGIDTDTLVSIENAVGSAFNDTIVSSDGANRFDGGGGIDTVSYEVAGRAMLVNLGGQAATDGIASDTLISIENVIGSRFSDTIFGDGLDNILDGGPGGADQINGGGGIDTVSYVTSARAVLINLASQAAADGVDNDTLSSIENAIGSRFGDSIIGDGLANILDGAEGADALTGGGGDDTFLFRRGQANGDTVADFAGNGSLPGDMLQFVGYGAGTFTQIDSTHWQINSEDGLTHETITFQNSAAVHSSEVLFA